MSEESGGWPLKFESQHDQGGRKDAPAFGSRRKGRSKTARVRQARPLKSFSLLFPHMTAQPSPVASSASTSASSPPPPPRSRAVAAVSALLLLALTLAASPALVVGAAQPASSIDAAPVTCAANKFTVKEPRPTRLSFCAHHQRNTCCDSASYVLFAAAKRDARSLRLPVCVSYTCLLWPFGCSGEMGRAATTM